LHALKENNNL